MKSLEESVVTAMDGADVELFPFLPYILQDIWEIGASPETINKIIFKYKEDYSSLEVLDLGCGKGVVSVKAAKEFNIKCYGIDAIEEFINYANEKAAEYGVVNLCLFEKGDIRLKIKELNKFDVIILGAIGPIFGDYDSTLATLSNNLTEKGIIIIDNGYIENNSDFKHPLIEKRSDILKAAEKNGMDIIEEIIHNKEDIIKEEIIIYNSLKKRCLELIERHPEKRDLFLNYIKNQEYEAEVNENKIICSTMAFRKKK